MGWSIEWDAKDKPFLSEDEYNSYTKREAKRYEIEGLKEDLEGEVYELNELIDDITSYYEDVKTTRNKIKAVRNL